MDNVDTWKILRVLTSNVCNFECFFCHNEGQTLKKGKPHFLKFEDFRNVLDAIKTTKIKEIHFSGGEPFMNTETIKMIKYVNINTDFDIGCATNTYFLDNEVISELKNTRIKLNIQFPAVNQYDFLQITHNDYFSQLTDKVDTFKRNQINFGLNHVIHSSNLNSVSKVIDFAIQNEISLKLLPQLDTGITADSKNQIFSFLDSVSQRKLNKGTGAHKWFINNHSSKEISIIFVDSPCFYDDFETCKQYGEVRLLPNLILQTCINQTKFNNEFNLELCQQNKELILKRFLQTWKNFTKCE